MLKHQISHYFHQHLNFAMGNGPSAHETIFRVFTLHVLSGVSYKCNLLHFESSFQGYPTCTCISFLHMAFGENWDRREYVERHDANRSWKVNQVKRQQIKIANKKKKEMASRSRLVGIRLLMSNEDYRVAKSICPNWQMYLFKLTNVFVQIDKCMCPN